MQETWSESLWSARRIAVASLCVLATILVSISGRAEAAVGCALNDPEQDLRRFFPEFTDFTTQIVTFQTQNPGALVRLGALLGDKLDPIYETADVPYNLYAVSRNGERLGHVFGANQRGRYSNIQVILITDADLQLKDVYLQKIRSPSWEAFRSERFLGELLTVPLESYPTFKACYVDGDCDGLPIADPTGGQETEDFRHILRAMAKLHLLTRLLHHPVSPRPPDNLQARAERLVSWWNGGEAPEALDQGTFAPQHQVEFLGADDPVLLMDSGDSTRVYPLMVWNRHPVVNEKHGRGFRSVIWSPTSYSAVMLPDYGASEVHGFEPSTELLFGTGIAIDRATRNEWAPGIGQVVRGSRLGAESVPIGGAVVMPWGVARQHRPDAEILVVETAPDELRERWIEYRDRYFVPGERDRITVVASDHGFAGWASSALERTPLIQTTLGEQPVVVVGAGPVVSAFQASVGDRPLSLVQVGTLFWAGAPLLWDAESGTLWEGYTGEVLVPGAVKENLRALAVYALSRETFRLLLPRSRIDI